MNKRRLIIIISIIGVILVATMFTIFAIVGKQKTPITAEEFKTKLESKGYITADATYQYSEYDYIKQVYIAANNDYSYQIEFYELSNVDYAMNFYNTNKNIFESTKGSSINAETNVELKNYAKYTLSVNGKYKVISRINNTVIYIDVEDNNKDTVKKVLEEIGY